MCIIYLDIIEASSLDEAKHVILLKFQELKDDSFLDLYSQNKIEYPLCSKSQLISMTINLIKSNNQIDYLPLIFTDIISLDVMQETEEEAHEFLAGMTNSRGILYIVPFKQYDETRYLCYGVSR